MRVRGVVYLNDTGPPELVFGRQCKEDQLEHEVFITEAELLLDGTCQRSVPVGKTVADALLVRDQNRFWLEIDNETESTKQLRDKWLRMGDVDGFILVICRTKARLRKLIRSAEHVKTKALFTRFRWLASKFVREPWVDWYGKRVRI